MFVEVAGVSCSNALVLFLCDIRIFVRGVGASCKLKQIFGVICILLLQMFVLESWCCLFACFIQCYIL